LNRAGDRHRKSCRSGPSGLLCGGIGDGIRELECCSRETIGRSFVRRIAESSRPVVRDRGQPKKRFPPAKVDGHFRKEPTVCVAETRLARLGDHSIRDQISQRMLYRIPGDRRQIFTFTPESSFTSCCPFHKRSWLHNMPPVRYERPETQKSATGFNRVLQKYFSINHRK
jgi:hypothetical protein